MRMHIGPEIMPQGDSLVELEVALEAFMITNTSLRIAVAVYKTDDENRFESLSNMCAQVYWDDYYEPWADYVYRDVVTTTYKGPLNSQMNTEYPAGTRWVAQADVYYKVVSEGWYNVAFKVCDEDGTTEKVLLDGHVGFRNPYGYLMGEMWGQIPFQVCRVPTLYSTAAV